MHRLGSAGYTSPAPRHRYLPTPTVATHRWAPTARPRSPMHSAKMIPPAKIQWGACKPRPPDAAQTHGILTSNIRMPMTGCSAQPGRALTERTRGGVVVRLAVGQRFGHSGAGRRPSMTCHSRLGFNASLPALAGRSSRSAGRRGLEGRRLGQPRPWPLRASGPGWCGPWCAWSGHSTRDRRRAAGASGQSGPRSGPSCGWPGASTCSSPAGHLHCDTKVVHLGASVPCKDSAAHWSACVGSRGQPGSGVAVIAEVSRNALISDTRPFEPPRSRALARRREQRRAEAVARRPPRPDPRPDTDHDWLAVSEVARLIGLTRPRVMRRIHFGRLPATRVGHRWWVRTDRLELVERVRLPQRMRVANAPSSLVWARPAPGARD